MYVCLYQSNLVYDELQLHNMHNIILNVFLPFTIFQMGLSRKPPVNVNGAYCKSVDIREPNSRDKLVSINFLCYQNYFCLQIVLCIWI